MLRGVDLILILWPIFFIAAPQQEPHLKTREFVKPARKAAEQLGGTVEIPTPLKHIMASSGGHGKSIDTAQNKLSDLTGNLRHRSSYMLNGRRMVLEVWKYRSGMVSSPRVGPACDNHC